MIEFTLSRRKSLVFPESVEDSKGTLRAIRPGHQTVLKIFRLLRDEDLAEHHRIAKACDLFYTDSSDFKGSFDRMLKFINNDEELEAPEDNKQSSNGKKVFDFEFDAPEVYASFLQMYGIDLMETDVHWYRFGVLLSSLLRTEDTPLSAKLHLRTLDTSNLKGKAKSRAEAAKHSVEIPTKMSKYDEMMEDRLLDAIQRGENPEKVLKDWK